MILHFPRTHRVDVAAMSEPLTREWLAYSTGVLRTKPPISVHDVLPTSFAWVKVFLPGSRLSAIDVRWRTSPGPRGDSRASHRFEGRGASRERGAEQDDA
eukprot:4003739-Pyramimonas_sp.AAC.1